MKILFICRGNVGRSQIAEAVFDKITKGKYEVMSAGTWVHGYMTKMVIVKTGNF